MFSFESMKSMKAYNALNPSRILRFLVCLALRVGFNTPIAKISESTRARGLKFSPVAELEKR